MTCPHKHQSKIGSEARPPPPTGQDQARIGANPTLQVGGRVWYLDTQPSKLDPTLMDEAWTWPWVVFFKEAPGLYPISAYS